MHTLYKGFVSEDFYTRFLYFNIMSTGNKTDISPLSNSWCPQAGLMPAH